MHRSISACPRDASGCTQLDDDFLKDSEDGARRLLNDIEGYIRVALSPEVSPVLAPENKRELERALDRLRPSFDELAKWFIDPMRETKPSRAMYGYEKLWEFMDAVFVVGSRGVVTESHKKFHDAEGARTMRAGRDRPEILEAIIAVRGHNNPADHPYSVAALKLDSVNAWLEEHGYKPVKSDALARRIPHT
jgi:hypothetical protein